MDWDPLNGPSRGPLFGGKFAPLAVNQRANVSFSGGFGSPDVTLNETTESPESNESGLLNSVECSHCGS